MCWKCKQDIGAKPGFRDICPECGADLHVCRNCRFYQVGSHHDCRESQSDEVRDKDRGNFCEYFSLPPQSGKGGDGAALPPDQSAKKARSDFDRLFG